MPQSNRKIGPYTLIRKIGRGAFGVVWLAEKRTSIATSRVALKVAHEHEVDLTSFKREAEIWIEASGHPNILSIIEADVYDGQAVIVSEYAPGGSLRTWLENHDGRAPSLDVAAEMSMQILGGLEHLHSKRIIHRDIKPDNILLQHEIPRLVDFGIARVIKSETHSGGVVGTLAYMAPECFDGKRNQQTDLWAVGVLLFEMLAGHLPYNQSDTASLISAIVGKDPPPLPESVPQPLRQVVERALTRNPIMRYESAREMRLALRFSSFELRRSDPPPTVRSLPFRSKTLKVDQQLRRDEVQRGPEKIRKSAFPERMVKAGSVFAIAGGVALVLFLLMVGPGRFTSLLKNRSTVAPSLGRSPNLPSTQLKASTHAWHTEIITGCLVKSLAFSPDGKLLAGGTWCDGGLTLWDVETGEVSLKVGSTSGYSVAFSPDGKVLAAGTGEGVSLWDLQNKSLIKTLSTPAGGMMEIAFSRDGTRLAARVCCDGVTIFWLENGRVQQVINTDYDVGSLAFSPDGKTLATGSDYDSGGVSLWDAKTGTLRRKLVSSGRGGWVAFSPDSKLVTSGSGDDIIVWDTRTGVLKETLTYPGSDINVIAFSPDGKTIAAGGGYWEISIWDVQIGTLRRKLSGHKDWVTALAFSPDGKLLASGSGDGTIKLWRYDSY